MRESTQLEHQPTTLSKASSRDLTRQLLHLSSAGGYFGCGAATSCRDGNQEMSPMNWPRVADSFTSLPPSGSQTTMRNDSSFFAFFSRTTCATRLPSRDHLEITTRSLGVRAHLSPVVMAPVWTSNWFTPQGGSGPPTTPSRVWP